MNYTELLKNARESAEDALALLPALEKLSPDSCFKRPLLSRIVAELQTAADEAHRALNELPKN